MSLYLHFGEFMKQVVTRVDREIELARAAHPIDEVGTAPQESVAVR
jgi:hypothetical protein